MGKPARDAVYECELRGTERMILLILADHSASPHSPFEAYPGVDRIAHCAGLARRQTQRYLQRLVEHGTLERYRRGQHVWGYRILLPDVSPDDTLEPDVSHDDTLEPSDVSPDDTLERRRGVSHVDTLDNPGVSFSNPGVSSEYSLIRNERKRTKENEERDAHTRDPIPLPSSVMTADQAWQLILQYLEGEVSSHERQTWRQRVRAGWSGPDILCLRGPASLVRLGRFTGCVRMAANQLDMGAVIEFSAIGA